MKKILIVLCFLPYLLPAQNIVQADTVRAKYGFSMGVTPTRITVREITKVVNAASTHLQLPTAKAVWDAITANVLNVSAGSGISISGTPPNITISATDVSNSNEGVLGVGAGGASSSTIVTNTSGGNAVTINVAGDLSISESTSSNGGSVTITGTGAAALSGVVNQVPYFNTTSTITTEAGSGANAFTWDAANNFLGIGTTSPGSVLDARGGINQNVVTSYYTYQTGTGPKPFRAFNQDGLETFAIGGQRAANEGNLFLRAPSVQGSGAGITFSSNNGGTAVSGIFQLDNSGNMVFRQENGSGSMYYDFQSGVFFRNSALSDVNHINTSGWLSVAAGNSHPRTLFVNGEARINDLTTDTPTRIVGADADGDLGAITVGSGLSLSGGTLSVSSASAWLLGGNTLGAANTIGSNDNFDVSIETNGTSRLWVDNTGPVTVGSTVSTAAALVVNGLQSNTGLAILGGTGLVAPAYISTRGDGSGTTAQVLDSRHSMIGGTVATIVENTATTLNSNAITSLIVNSGSTGDPYTAYTISGGTQWVEGIDNSDADKFKVRNASTLTTTNTGLTLTTNNLFGVNQNAPTLTAEFTGADGVGIPQGTTGNRPSLTGEAPVLRYNSSFGGFEVGDPNKNAWFRLTALSAPAVTTGAAAGTGASVSLASGLGGNDCSGTIDLVIGSSPATGVLLTLTYFEPYNGTTTFVTLDPGNDIATTQQPRYSCQASSNTQFTIRAVTALDAGQTYRIKYNVRSY